MKGAWGPPPPPPGARVEIIDADETHRQARWLVHGDRRAVEAIRDTPGVTGLAVETPSLEDIYIGYMRRRPLVIEPRPVAVAVVA